MKEYDVQRAADRVVKRHVMNKWGEALRNLLAEKNGVGCGCKNCAYRVVRAANSWTHFGIEDPIVREEKKYHVDGNGVIKRGGDSCE